VAVAASSERFPVHRIYCVGRNYADHVHEMGADRRASRRVLHEPADAVWRTRRGSLSARTANFHHEIELVVAIGRGGRDIREPRALEHVLATRRAMIDTPRSAARREAARPAVGCCQGL